MSGPIVYEPPALRHIHPLASLARLRQFSDLFVTLSLHRISVRYRQSRLGILWAVLQPLAMMLVFTLVFTLVRASPGGNVPLPLFVYSALIPWTMFSSGLSAAAGALTSHAALLTKVSFPREILPLTYVVAALVDCGVAALVLAPLMIYYGVSPTWTAIWAVAAIAILTVFLIALALLVSAIQVRYRDVGLAMPVLLQVWLFVTPVIYSLDAARDAIPPALYRCYVMNPLAGSVDAFRRAVVLQQAPDAAALAVSAAIAAVLLPLAYIYFKYAELTMADAV
jgi:homopolymeric O-antigen transport system permease protein